MGLNERRSAKDFQEKLFPGLKKQVEDLIGSSITWDINWDSMAADGYDHLYAEAWPQVYFNPVIQALKQICTDDMGKQAVKSGLKKITFCDVEHNSYAGNAITFADGTLKIDHEPCTNLNQEGERTAAVAKALEAGL